MKVVVALCAFSLAAAASAQTAPGKADAPPAQTASASTPKPDPGDRVTCRDDETTGERIKSRICHTKREWDAMEGAAKAQMHDLQGRGASCAGCR